MDTTPDPRDDPETAVRKQIIAAGLPTQIRQGLQRENAAGEDPPHPVWDTDAFRRDFEAIGFLAPFVRVRRRADGKVGTMMFEHHPRYYFNFLPDGEG